MVYSLDTTISRDSERVDFAQAYSEAAIRQSTSTLPTVGKKTPSSGPGTAPSAPKSTDLLRQEAIARRFAPLVKLAPDDISSPASIDWYLPFCELKQGSSTIVPRGQVTSAIIARYDNKDYYLKPDLNKTKSGPGFVNGYSQAECYVNFVQKPYVTYRQNDGKTVVLQDGGLVLQYILFYPYQGSLAPGGTLSVLESAFEALDAGIHESDWEHIDVHLKKVGSGNSPQDYQLDKIFVARHQQVKGDVVSAAQMPKVNDQMQSSSAGTHPVIYTAKNSHASYYKPQNSLNDDFDRTYEGGPLWKTWEQVRVIGSLENPYPGMEWIQFGGRWGATTLSGAHGESPTGPGGAGWYRKGTNDFLRKVKTITANTKNIDKRVVLKENAAFKKIKDLISKLSSIDDKITNLKKKLAGYFGESSEKGTETAQALAVSGTNELARIEAEFKLGDPDATLNYIIRGRNLNASELQDIVAALDKGADVNLQTYYSDYANGWTPLHYAASMGQVAILKLLLERGADASIKSSAGLTPSQILDQADLPESYKQEMRALLSSGVKVAYHEQGNLKDLNYHINFKSIGKDIAKGGEKIGKDIVETGQKGTKFITEGGKKVAVVTIGGVDKAANWAETTSTELADTAKRIGSNLGSGDFEGAALEGYKFAKTVLKSFEAAFQVAFILAQIAKLEAERATLYVALKATRAEGKLNRNSDFTTFAKTAVRYNHFLWLWVPKGETPIPTKEQEVVEFILSSGVNSLVSLLKDIEFYIYRKGEKEIVEILTAFWIKELKELVFRPDEKKRGPIWKGDVLTDIIGPSSDDQYYVADLKSRGSTKYTGSFEISAYGVEL